MMMMNWFFHNNFYKYTRIFMIFGIQLCKWILIILVNLLRSMPCTSLTSWRDVDVTEIMPFTDEHFIKILRKLKEKRYSSRKFIREFPNKNWSRRGLDYLIKLNVLLSDIRSVFRDYHVFSARWAPAHRARDTVAMLQRETPEFIPPEMCPANSPDLIAMDYSIFKTGSTVRGSFREWRQLDDIIAGSRQRLRSGVVFWMRVLAWMVDNLNTNF